MDDNGMMPVDPGWQAAVLVCCNQRPAEAVKASCGDKGVHFREELKRLVKDAGLRDRVLVANTTCLGVCSPWGTTVALLAGGRRVMWVVPTGTSAARAWTAIAAAMETP